MPSVRISANSVTTLRLSPKAHIIPAANSSAAGMPAATQIAVRALRNRNSTPSTSAMPNRALSSSSASRASTTSTRVDA